MKDKCQLINDLLPLYEEKMLSEYSESMVREHLETCRECAEKYADFQLPKAEKNDLYTQGDLDLNLKKRYTFLKWHFLVIAIAAIAVQLLGEVYYYKFIRFNEFGYVRIFLISINFFLPLLSFLLSIKIMKQRYLWKIVLQQFGLIVAVNVYQIIFYAAYMKSIQIKAVLDVYVSGLPVFVLYATVPVLVGLVIESLYKWIRGKMMKIEM